MKSTKDAVEWCKKYGLIFDAVNDNLPEIVEAFGEIAERYLQMST